MGPVVESLLQGVPVLLLHLGVAIAVLVAALAIYIAITPHKEIALIRAGNAAAAVLLGGTALSLAIPLAFCLAGAVNAWDILLWGLLTLTVQVITATIIDLVVLPNLPRRIARGDMAAAALLTGVKLSMAALLAAAVAV
ncbi:DUF350 domain-containing protein [Pedomonas mirosovicensis]|uniref:DUF350 domain-containing protein n=1 Tax=Pedomonas mirosovicensis TaxID=2908641 RepID=UPI002169FF2E|nr:DUF350 domain-containing protein [Pedomonas mirosovicensis]MCH8684211.1 DUF350 domain-containing protein [Pedomonas mirosovicensis]